MDKSKQASCKGKYTLEFKLEAVRLFTAGSRCQARQCRANGVGAAARGVRAAEDGA
jgi:hypothetical protein